MTEPVYSVPTAHSRATTPFLLPASTGKMLPGPIEKTEGARHRALNAQFTGIGMARHILWL